jgi:predicted phosphodiesterase
MGLMMRALAYFLMLALVPCARAADLEALARSIVRTVKQETTLYSWLEEKVGRLYVDAGSMNPELHEQMLAHRGGHMGGGLYASDDPVRFAGLAAADANGKARASATLLETHLAPGAPFVDFTDPATRAALDAQGVSERQMQDFLEQRGDSIVVRNDHEYIVRLRDQVSFHKFDASRVNLASLSRIQPGPGQRQIISAVVSHLRLHPEMDLAPLLNDSKIALSLDREVLWNLFDLQRARTTPAEVPALERRFAATLATSYDHYEVMKRLPAERVADAYIGLATQGACDGPWCIGEGRMLNRNPYARLLAAQGILAEIEKAPDAERLRRLRGALGGVASWDAASGAGQLGPVVYPELARVVETAPSEATRELFDHLSMSVKELREGAASQTLEFLRRPRVAASNAELLADYRDRPALRRSLPAATSKPQLHRIDMANAKIGFLADVHGDRAKLITMLEGFKRDGVTHIVGLGDYIGTTDQLRDILPLLEKHSGIPPSRSFLMPGDWEHERMGRARANAVLSEFGTLIAEDCNGAGILEVGGKRILVSHRPPHELPDGHLGSRFNRAMDAPRFGAMPADIDLAAFGDSHIRTLHIDPLTKTVFFNPGTLSSMAEPWEIPGGGVFDVAKGQLEVINADTSIHGAVIDLPSRASLAGSAAATLPCAEGYAAHAAALKRAAQ